MAVINDEVLEAVDLLSDFSEGFTRLLYRETKDTAVPKAELLKAVELLSDFNAGERRQISSMYNARQKAWMDRQSQLDGYYKKGLEEGRAEGKAVVESIRKLKASGVSTDIIVKSTGLSPEEIAGL
jgi:predicted transposase/invertase (TIGR01784 family)